MADQFTFYRVQPGSETAAILSLPPDVYARFDIYACEAHRCPECGRKTLYWQKVTAGMDLFHPEFAKVLAHITMRAMLVGYNCPNCGIDWCDLTAWYVGKGLELPELVALSC